MCRVIDMPALRSPAKVGVWAYHVKDAGSGLNKVKEGTSLTLNRASFHIIGQQV